MRDAVAALNVKPDEGDEWLRVGGMKLGVDGGFEGGWMRQPYAEPWGEGGTFFGVNTMKQAPYTDVVKELNRLGWRVATHAVGDAAIDEVIAAYEAANAEKPIAGKRWVLEHGFIAQPDQFPRLKKLDLVISAQDHLYLAGPSLVNYWGPARAARTTPMRAFIDHGFVVAGGTDSSVVPYPPLWVIYHFVTRDTISGGVLGADQRITRKEALQVETINNAYLTFEERIKGSIEPGKLADLVVLPEDILTVPAKHIEQMQRLDDDGRRHGRLPQTVTPYVPGNAARPCPFCPFNTLELVPPCSMQAYCDSTLLADRSRAVPDVHGCRRTVSRTRRRRAATDPPPPRQAAPDDDDDAKLRPLEPDFVTINLPTTLPLPAQAMQLSPDASVQREPAHTTASARS